MVFIHILFIYIPIIELVHFSEKPDAYVSDLINCGVYLFSSDMYNKKYYLELEHKYASLLDSKKEGESEQKLEKL